MKYVLTLFAFWVLIGIVEHINDAACDGDQRCIEYTEGMR